MILPTKYLPIEQSLLGVGALLMSKLRSGRTVSALWSEVKEREEVGSFERFTLSLDLLYAMGIIDLRDGIITKVVP